MPSERFTGIFCLYIVCADAWGIATDSGVHQAADGYSAVYIAEVLVYAGVVIVEVFVVGGVAVD